MKKIGRDAFLYLEPKEGEEKDFAQCATCVLWVPEHERCAIHGPAIPVPAMASCGLYIPGEPDDRMPIVRLVTPEESGLVDREVRCENCAHFDEPKSKCFLFERLNAEQGKFFKMDPKVAAKGCCNAQTPRAG